MEVSRSVAEWQSGTVARRLTLPAVVLCCSMIFAAPSDGWEPVSHTAECRDLAAPANQGPTLVIWHKAGDNADRDRAELQQMFSGQFRLEWRDVTQRNHALAARAAGVNGVPSFDAWLQGEASPLRVAGYKDALNLLQRLQGLGVAIQNNAPVGQGHTAPPERPPAHHAVPRRTSPEVPATRGEISGLAERVEQLETRVGSVEDAQANLLTNIEQTVAQWNQAAGEWQQTIRTLDQEVAVLQTRGDQMVDRLDEHRRAIEHHAGVFREHKHTLQEIEQRQTRAESGGIAQRFEQHVSGENKELSDTHTPGVLGWLGFSAIQLLTIGGITAATGGTGLLAWWAGNSIKRRMIAFVARRAARRVAKRLRGRMPREATDGGRSEVRPQDDHFPRIHRPAEGDGVSMQPDRGTAGLGPWERTETGYVRSADGGPLRKRFDKLERPGEDQPTAGDD
jgi:hypothetical protein